MVRNISMMMLVFRTIRCSREVKGVRINSASLTVLVLTALMCSEQIFRDAEMKGLNLQR
jgi:hypothetical protein